MKLKVKKVATNKWLTKEEMNTLRAGELLIDDQDRLCMFFYRPEGEYISIMVLSAINIYELTLKCSEILIRRPTAAEMLQYQISWEE